MLSFLNLFTCLNITGYSFILSFELAQFILSLDSYFSITNNSSFLLSNIDIWEIFIFSLDILPFVLHFISTLLFGSLFSILQITIELFGYANGSSNWIKFSNFELKLPIKVNWPESVQSVKLINSGWKMGKILVDVSFPRE